MGCFGESQSFLLKNLIRKICEKRKRSTCMRENTGFSKVEKGKIRNRNTNSKENMSLKSKLNEDVFYD